MLALVAQGAERLAERQVGNHVRRRPAEPLDHVDGAGARVPAQRRHQLVGVLEDAGRLVAQALVRKRVGQAAADAAVVFLGRAEDAGAAVGVVERLALGPLGVAGPEAEGVPPDLSLDVRQLRGPDAHDGPVLVVQRDQDLVGVPVGAGDVVGDAAGRVEQRPRELLQGRDEEVVYDLVDDGSDTLIPVSEYAKAVWKSQLTRTKPACSSSQVDRAMLAIWNT